MIEPQMNTHQGHCLSRAERLTADHQTEDMASDSIQIRDDHHLPYIGDFPPEPSSKKGDIHAGTASAQ